MTTKKIAVGCYFFYLNATQYHFCIRINQQPAVSKTCVTYLEPQNLKNTFYFIDVLLFRKWCFIYERSSVKTHSWTRSKYTSTRSKN